ncbi:MAG TPA: hypothetical protein VKK31_10375 [Thermoanaerobaculia bacterium]|nr:hypothetical protein [Thermoanaerobaculia bacterium]
MKSFARTMVGVLLPLGLAAAPAAHARTTYIPLPGISAVGPVSYDTQISITNTRGRRLAVKSLRLDPGVDGTAREGLAASRLSVVPRKTVALRPSPGARGLLELDAPEGLQYSASLVSTDGRGFRTDLPVIDSDSLTQANETLVVEGLEGSSSKTTDVVLVNLGDTAATCSASVLRADGNYAIDPVEISLSPLSHLVFANIFRSMADDIADANLEVNCSNDFYAYAQTADAATGRLTIVEPFALANVVAMEKMLKAAGPCSAGSMLCNMPNQVHTATKANPTRALTMTPPVGTYSSILGHVEVTVTGWNKANLRGAHGVLYLVINRNKYQLASIFLRGPGKNNVTVRHGVCAGGCNKAKIEKGVPVQLGETYVFDYVYDAARKNILMRMTHRGELVAVITDKPNISRIQVKSGDKVVIGLSNPDVNSREEPSSIGWTYSNLRVELFR